MIRQKTGDYPDGKVGNLEQRNLVRLMPYRRTSVDSGLQAPALNFLYFRSFCRNFIEGGTELCAGILCLIVAFFAFSQW